MSWGEAIELLRKATPAVEAETAAYSQATGIPKSTVRLMEMEGRKAEATKSAISRFGEGDKPVERQRQPRPPPPSLAPTSIAPITPSRPGSGFPAPGETFKEVSRSRSLREASQAHTQGGGATISARQPKHEGAVIEPTYTGKYAKAKQRGMEAKPEPKAWYGLGSGKNPLTRISGPGNTIRGYKIDINQVIRELTIEAGVAAIGGGAFKIALKSAQVGGKSVWRMLPSHLKAPIAQAAKEGKKVAQPVLDNIRKFFSGSTFKPQPRARTGTLVGPPVKPQVAKIKAAEAKAAKAKAAKAQAKKAEDKLNEALGLKHKVAARELPALKAPKVKDYDALSKKELQERIKLYNDPKAEDVLIALLDKEQKLIASGKWVKPQTHGSPKSPQYTLESVKKKWREKVDRILQSGDAHIVMGEGVSADLIKRSKVLPKGQVEAIEKTVVDKLKLDPRWNNRSWRQSREFIDLYKDNYYKLLIEKIKSTPGGPKDLINFFADREYTRGIALLGDPRSTMILKSWTEANNLLKGIYDPEALIPPAWGGAIHIFKSIYETPDSFNTYKEQKVNTNINNWSDACNLLSLI